MVLKEMIAKNREIGKKSSSVKKEEFKKIGSAVLRKMEKFVLGETRVG